MQVVVDIPEEVYKAYKMDSSLSFLGADQKSIAESYLINGLINGTPLNEVLNNIRYEINLLPRDLPTDARNMIRKTRVLDIIDKYRGEVDGKID